MSKNVERFRIEAVNAPGMDKNVIVDAQCTAPFMSMVLASAIVELNEKINKSNILKVKNGFWLILQDTVNDTLKELAEDKQ